jgi:hypothetical protein
LTALENGGRRAYLVSVIRLKAALQFDQHTREWEEWEECLSQQEQINASRLKTGLAILHWQTPCRPGSHRKASRPRCRSHRSSHPQCFLHRKSRHEASSARQRLRARRTFQVCQVKPRHITASNQRLIDSLDRGLDVPLICSNQGQKHRPVIDTATVAATRRLRLTAQHHVLLTIGADAADVQRLVTQCHECALRVMSSFLGQSTVSQNL